MGAYGYVTNGNSGSISVIDTSTNLVVNTIGGINSTPEVIAISPNGYFAYIMYSPPGFSESIALFSLSSNSIIKRIDCGGSPGSGALSGSGVIVSPDGGTVYTLGVGNYEPAGGDYDILTVISTSSNELVATIALQDLAHSPTDSGYGANSLTITPDGATLYIASVGRGTIIAVDTATNTIKRTITGLNPGYWGVYQTLVASHDSSTIYAANHTTSIYQTYISLISTATNTVVGNVTGGYFNDPTYGNTVYSCGGLQISPDGNYIYCVAMWQAGSSSGSSVVKISTSSNTVVGATIISGQIITPITTAITPDGSTFYVVNEVAGTVTAFQTSTLVNLGSITVGASPISMAITNFSGYDIVMTV